MNVLIGQPSQNRYHRHSHSHTHGYGTCWISGAKYSGVYPEVGSDHRSPNYSYTANTGGASDSNTAYNGNSTNQEARSENFTYKIWVRIA